MAKGTARADRTARKNAGSAAANKWVNAQPASRRKSAAAGIRRMGYTPTV